MTSELMQIFVCNTHAPRAENLVKGQGQQPGPFDLPFLAWTMHSQGKEGVGVFTIY